MNRPACPDFRELISAFIDGEISSDDRARLMGHLSTCVECRETLEVYRLIGTRVRSMPPIQPPEHLIDSIFGETIDAQPRRLFVVTSRLGYSLAAVAAVVLIFVVAAYLLVGGYQRGIQPSVASSAPQNGETWPIQKPIEITFNKAMNHQSVLDALAILPCCEDQRLTATWDGNTLIIGQDQTLKSATTYQIRIGSSAEDTFGNPLRSEFSLSFGTTSTVEVAESPTPFPTVAVVESPSPTSTVQQPQATPTATVASTPAGDATTEPVSSPTATRDTSGGIGVPGTPAATSESTPAVDEPTATVAPDETETVEPTEDVDSTEIVEATDTPEPTPTETSVPIPTMTPTTEPTATSPAATPTQVVIPVVGGFGDVYWDSDPTVRDRLGQPLSAASSTGALLLGFQGGNMYFRSDNGSIYVFGSADLTWGSFLDTSSSSPEPQPVQDDPDHWIPGGILGYLWNAEPSVREELGYANEQYPVSFSAEVQEFEGGLMLSSPDTIWVLYDDLTWEYFPNSGS